MTAGMLTAVGRAGAVATLGLAVLAPIAGCRSLARHEQNRIPQLGEIDPHQPKELEKTSLPPRVVEPPDELELNVRPADPDLVSTRYIVQPEGTIDLGFYGDVYVSGLTLNEIKAKILQHLAHQYAMRGNSKKPPTEISVRISDDQSKFFYVLGTVSNQGRFPVSGSTTVLDAVLLAGIRTNSLPEKAYLVRPHPTGAQDTILRIDWDGITKRGDTLTNYQVLPGDRIYVPGTRPPGLLSTLIGSGL